MAIEEKNALELVFSYTVTPGDTEVIIDGMDNKNETYLLIINNAADRDWETQVLKHFFLL